MDEELLKKLIEIISLEEDDLEIFGYSSTIGLYDVNEIEWSLTQDWVSEFYVGDEYFSMMCNKEFTEFLFKRINKEEYDRLTLISRGLDNKN